MKTVRKRMIIGVFIIIGIMACSCEMKKNNSDESKDITLKSKPEIVLNESQKEILEEVGLPTDAEELDSSQQEAIIAIDEMLTEIEKKYNTSFSYAGYIAPGPLEHEQLIAYPTEGSSRDTFTVTRGKENGKYVYEDEYANVLAEHVYTSYILKYCQTQVGEENVKIYSIITGIKEKKTQFQEKDIANNISGESCVFVDGGRVTEEDYNEFLLNYKQWIKEQGINDDTEFILLKEGLIDEVNGYSYTDYLSAECYLRGDFEN